MAKKRGATGAGTAVTLRSGDGDRQPISTIFISSRMEEVVAERRAAFDAVFSSGLVPLMFEAASDLRHADRERIDTLIDKADLFLGIYDRTLGDTHLPEFPSLTPLEYELARFVFAVELRETVRDAQRFREELARRLGPKSEELVELRRGRRGRYAETLRYRVRLYARDGGFMEKSLFRFLQPYFVDTLAAERIVRDGESPHFSPIPVVLHDRIRRDVAEAFATRFQRCEAGSSGLRVVVSLKDEPGSLERLLQKIFACGLNLLHIDGGQHRGEYRVTVLAQHFSGDHPSLAGFKNEVKTLIANNKTCVLHDCEGIEDVAAAVGDLLKSQSDLVVPPHSWVLRVRTLRAPGILSTVCNRLARRRMNIATVRHVRTSESTIVQEQRFEIVFDPPENMSREDREATLARLNYEVPSIYGVLSAWVERPGGNGRRSKPGRRPRPGEASGA